MKLSDARVVLTGASGGIGTAVALCLVNGGAHVLLTGRSSATLFRLVETVTARTKFGYRVSIVAADVTTNAGREALRRAAEAFGANVLINNAGVPGFGALESLPAAALQAAVNTNLLAPIQLTAALLPQLRKQPRSLVINVGSTLGSIGMPGFSAYGATKAGLRVFSEALRRELIDTTVRIQYLAPRTVKTTFNDSQADAFNTATGSHADPPDVVAHAVLKMIRTEQAELFLGMFERLAARMNEMFPRLLDSGFATHRRALKAHPSLDQTGK
jgi:short-subunit dehydrogenase